MCSADPQPSDRDPALRSDRRCILHILEPSDRRLNAGKHFRHVLDHLRILLDSIEAGKLARLACFAFDYDSRMSSKVAHIETSVAASLREFERTNSRFYRIFEGSKGELYTQPLRLCATTPFVVEMDSTVGRELWFVGCMPFITMRSRG